MKKITYSQSVASYNDIGIKNSSILLAHSLDALKIKRQRTLNKNRTKKLPKLELLIFGNIIETIIITSDGTNEMYQLTDVITNNSVPQELKNKAGELKRLQDRVIKLKKIQKKGKFKSHKRYH